MKSTAIQVLIRRSVTPERVECRLATATLVAGMVVIDLDTILPG